jgi:hypothetical protein
MEEAPLAARCHQEIDCLMTAVRYAYAKARHWHASPLVSAWAACRYALTGDTGYFRSHAGWRLSRIHRGSLAEDD